MPEHEIPDYFQQTLGVRPRISAWEGVDRLPAFLADRYRFARLELEGRALLLMVDEAPRPDAPAAIRKHTDQVRAKWEGPVVYVRDRVTSSNRKRLIGQRVSFVVPGNQMFLPELGLDLREYFRAPVPEQRTLRPATQAVLLLMLLVGRDEGATATEIAPLLGYTTMTLSRAFDELESLGLAVSETSGRERVLRLRAERREIWRRARPWLIDPVKSRHFVAISPGGLRAGHDALAHGTMLAEPTVPVVAIGREEWRTFTLEHPDAEVHDRESATTEVEVWKYGPREHDEPGVVDPLSLYLSIANQPSAGIADERVDQALDLLMEQLRW